jgi:hypothetical protein
MSDLEFGKSKLVEFVLIDVGGVEVPGLGSTFTVQVSKNGGSFNPGTGAKTEIGDGWYSYVLSATETDTAGPLALAITGAGAVQQNLLFQVLPSGAVSSVQPLGTRATVETILVNRRGKMMVVVGLSTAVTGGNTDLNDSIAYAVRIMGGTVANPLQVLNAEIDTVVALESLDAVLDVAELRLIKSIKGNLDVVDIVAGPFAEKLSQLASALDKDINRLEADVEQYGIGGVSVEAGVITLNISQHIDDPVPGSTYILGVNQIP